MTEEEIEAIAARAAAATPGPWHKEPGPDGYYWYDDLETQENGDFIAHARTDVPALVAALREANAKIYKLLQLRPNVGVKKEQ